MKNINVNTVFELSVDMCLNKAEAQELHYFLKHACTPPLPRVPGENTPHTDIVRRLADAIERGMK